MSKTTIALLSIVCLLSSCELTPTNGVFKVQGVVSTNDSVYVYSIKPLNTYHLGNTFFLRANPQKYAVGDTLYLTHLTNQP